MLIAALSFAATGAFAHSKVNKTIPENGAELSNVPDQVSFQFANKIRMTKIEMTHATHPSVLLDLGTQTAFDKDFFVPVQKMGAGVYQIEWRGLGQDGHPVKGEFMFTVE
jgi:methionine-rich copper-binding protein CopC